MKNSGQGNPKWSREETILALELYLNLNGEIPGPSDERVLDLSRLLRSNPRNFDQLSNDSFRNPSSVIFKLNNLRSAAGAGGFGNNSTLDRSLWAELGSRPERVADLSAQIRRAFAAAATEDLDANESELTFAEGELVTRLHKSRERSKKLRGAVLDMRRKDGAVACDLCGASPPKHLKQVGLAMLEVHHLVPLASSGWRSVGFDDVVLLCASCHRIAHALIVDLGEWLDLDRIRQELQPPDRDG